jgi:enoyl-CoA hydratase/carnithine racemase
MQELPAFDSLKLTIDEDGLIAVLELDHGKANEMGAAQIGEFESLVTWLSSSSVVALITTSSRRSKRGTPIFVSGANVTERIGWSQYKVRAHVRRQRQMLKSLRYIPQFHIAVVGGVALGWGAEYMLVCDYRIATDEASFALPETGLGIIPGAGGTSELWMHIGAAHALRLGMTGESVKVEEAQAIGLVQEHVATLDVGMARARSLAERVKMRSPTANAVFKKTLLDAAGRSHSVRQEREARAYEHLVICGQAEIGRTAFQEIKAGKRPDWGQKIWPFDD